jgi:hypothetical protein
MSLSCRRCRFPSAMATAIKLCIRLLVALSRAWEKRESEPADSLPKTSARLFQTRLVYASTLLMICVQTRSRTQIFQQSVNNSLLNVGIMVVTPLSRVMSSCSVAVKNSLLNVGIMASVLFLILRSR